MDDEVSTPPKVSYRCGFCAFPSGSLGAPNLAPCDECSIPKLLDLLKELEAAIIEGNTRE